MHSVRFPAEQTSLTNAQCLPAVSTLFPIKLLPISAAEGVFISRRITKQQKHAIKLVHDAAHLKNSSERHDSVSQKGKKIFTMHECERRETRYSAFANSSPKSISRYQRSVIFELDGKSFECGASFELRN